MAAQGQNFFVGLGRQHHLEDNGNECGLAGGRCVHRLGRRHGPDDHQRRRRLVRRKPHGPTPAAASPPTASRSPRGRQRCEHMQLPSQGCSTTLRNGPDVSANANFTFYVCADQTTCTANDYGGTSFAAPMWAGYLALANQQAAGNGDDHRLPQSAPLPGRPRARATRRSSTTSRAARAAATTRGPATTS